MCTSLYCIHNFFQNCAIHCFKLLGLAFFQVIWNHFKIIYMYLLRLSFLLFYDTRITFMINTFTGNSWNVLVLFLQLSFDSSVMYMYYIHFILYLVMLMVGLFCFFLPFSFEYIHIYIYESVCYHYLSVYQLKPASRCQRVLQVPSYLVHVQSNFSVWNNNILNTMDMLKWFKVQNRLPVLLNIFTLIF